MVEKGRGYTPQVSLGKVLDIFQDRYFHSHPIGQNIVT
jgi:hypothetical protein